MALLVEVPLMLLDKRILLWLEARKRPIDSRKDRRFRPRPSVGSGKQRELPVNPAQRVKIQPGPNIVQRHRHGHRLYNRPDRCIQPPLLVRTPPRLPDHRQECLSQRSIWSW